MPDEYTQSYVVTARKWRPQRFADVVGQEHVTRTLRNAVQSARIHHAYIFNGPRGVGKTTTARILAKAVNCENLSADCEPCNQCSSCLEINTGRSMDVIEIDGASNNSVDDIRKLRENAKYPPLKGSYKMYIIDEIHMLSTSAFNALLKTLEEPPKHLLFVFATTEPHKVPATILSRCQRFDFRRMQVDEIAAQLRYISDQEGVSIDDESLAIIGKKGDGSMRDSQSIFDQVVAFCGTTVQYQRVNEALNLIDQEFYFTLSRAIRERDVAGILNMAREVFARGYDLQECLAGLAEHYRNLLTVLATGDARLIEASKLHREQYVHEAQFFRQSDVLNLMNVLISTERELRFAPQPRLRFEFALVQMAKMDDSEHIGQLLAELAALKKKLNDTPRSTSDEVSSATQTKEREYNGSAYPAVHQITHQAVHRTKFAHGQSSIHEHAQNSSDQRFQQEAGNSALTDVLGDSSATAHTPNLVSAQQLAAEWHERLYSRQDLDISLRTYLLTSSQQSEQMCSIQYADGEVRISSPYFFVSDNIASKREHLESILEQAFGSYIRVVVCGGGKPSSGASLFDEYITSLPEMTPVATAPIVVPTNAISPAGESKESSPSQQTSRNEDSHALDEAIRQWFGAVPLPLR
jgi:DNA polymerase-3 subunit gamma/tau